jgi:hypothetical protein
MNVSYTTAFDPVSRATKSDDLASAYRTKLDDNSSFKGCTKKSTRLAWRKNARVFSRAFTFIWLRGLNFPGPVVALGLVKR